MSTCDSPVLFARDGAVAIVTLNRPNLGNAMDVPMSKALLDVAIACDCDRGIRAVLLNGRGKLFCAGGDLNAFAAAGPRAADLISEETAYLHSAVARFARMNKPLVVAVNGAAAGAGFGLALLGDIVIASEAAQFTLAYTSIGLSPDAGASWLLPRLVGLRKAQEMLLLNPRINAADALAAGMVTRVVSGEDLEAEALATAHKLASGPTLAFAHIRGLLLGSFSTELETQLELESRGIVDAVAGADGAGGVQAFLNKQKPVFGGTRN